MSRKNVDHASIPRKLHDHIGNLEVTFHTHDCKIMDHNEYSFNLLQIGRFTAVLVHISLHLSGDENFVLRFAQSFIEQSYYACSFFDHPLISMTVKLTN
jgi:hypothetical protein